MSEKNYNTTILNDLSAIDQATSDCANNIKNSFEICTQGTVLCVI